jgi:hypothetical protein
MAMKRQNYDNKTLDMIGKKLIEASRRRSVDIDVVIGNDKLFDGILARINEDAAEQGRFFLFGAKRLALLGSLATMLFVGAVAFSIYKPASNSIAAIRPQDRVAEPDISPVGPPPVAIDGNLSAGLSFLAENTADTQFERPTARPSAMNAGYRTTAKPDTFHEPEDDFYAVSYTGDPSETGGGRIIRVELPRSALFAMGVNIPLENDSPTVKADLLVGRDGVTRAVRVLN